MKLSPLVALFLAASVAEGTGVDPSPGSPAPFLAGADVSMLAYLEGHGVSYRDGGRVCDLLEILKDRGCNAIRLRLFVDPDGTLGQINTLPYTIALAQRVKAAGLRFFLDLHYSDEWADPKQQSIPRRWQSLDHDGLVLKIYAYTRAVLEAFQKAGCPPEMVQVGNEISNGFLWPDGGPLESGGRFDAFADLLRAAVAGVRASGDPVGSIAVMVHIPRGDKRDESEWFFENCVRRGVEFDAIGVSYYPYWHGEIGKLERNLAFLASTYGKPVYIVETGYDAEGKPDGVSKPFPFTPDGQREFLESLRGVLRGVPGGLGRGMFYWAPEMVEPSRWGGDAWAIPWAKRALFDEEGDARPALDALGAGPAMKADQRSD